MGVRVSDDRLSRGYSDGGGARFPVPPAPGSVPGWYPELLASVSTRVAGGQRSAIAAANRELVATYWAIGADILARQGDQGWGARIIDRLSADLRERFPDARGYSPRNLKYMRPFAAAWLDPAMVQDRLAQLPWYHQIALMEKLPTVDPRLWYAEAAVTNGWSRNVLAHHITTRLHERTGTAISNFAATLPPGDSDLAHRPPVTRTCSTSSARPTSAANGTSNKA